jgi:hypothetical protein
MINLHEAANLRLTIDHHPHPIRDLGPEISSLLRRASLGYIYDEQILPLANSNTLLAALATRSNTWPSAGSRSQEAEAIAIAAIGAGKRALIAPVITAPHHRLNIGLIAATQRTLFAALADAGSEQVAVLVREGASVVQSVLNSVGFHPSSTIVVTDFAQFVAYCAHPTDVLKHLGIAGIREDDVLALRLDPRTIRLVSSFHLTMEAATRPHFSGRPEWAEILPGLVGWGFYPIDAGINTPSPQPSFDINVIGNPGD